MPEFDRIDHSDMVNNVKPLRGGSAVDPLAGIFDNKSDKDKTRLANQALGDLGWFNDSATKMAEGTINTQKRIAVNAVETMDSFIDSVSKNTKDSAMDITNIMEEMFGETNKQMKAFTDKLKSEVDDVVEETKTATTSVQRFISKTNGDINQIAQKNVEMAKDLEKVVDSALGNIGISTQSKISQVSKIVVSHVSQNGGINHQELSSLVSPQDITTMAKEGANLAVKSAVLASTMMAMNAQAQSLGMMKGLGGDVNQINQFMGILPRIAVSARMSTGEVLALGMAFANNGIPITQSTKDLRGYLTIAGQAIQLLGISNDQAAKYTKNLMAQGFSASQVQKSFDGLYTTMQLTNQTTQDVIDSMAEATNLVAEFGGVAHRNMFEFTNDLLQIRGLFKGLGIDAKFAGDMIASSMKDGGMVGMRRAALAANALGGSSAQYFNQQMYDPAAGAKTSLQAAMTQLLQMVPTAGLSQAEMNKRFGGNQNAIMAANLSALRGQQMVGQMYGMNPAELSQALANYRGSGATSVSGWMSQREKEQAATRPPVEWSKAWDNVNNTFPKLVEQFTRVGQNLLIIFGSPIIGALTPLLTMANFVLDKIAMAMTSSNPIVKGLTQIISLGSLLFVTFGPLLNLFRLFAGLMGGLGALGSISGLLPVIIGGAIAAAVGALLISFGPGLIKAIGDGFNAAVKWLQSVDWWGLFTGKGKGSSTGIPLSGFNGGPINVPIVGNPTSGPIGSLPVDRNGRTPGWISAKYESGNAGAVNMDPNRSSGMDYGAWQFQVGTTKRFVDWLGKQNDPGSQAWAARLKAAEGSMGQEWNNKRGLAPEGTFAGEWMRAAGGDTNMSAADRAALKKNFLEAQRQFAWETYETPFNKHSRIAGNGVLQEDTFATSIQFGQGGAARLLRKAGVDDPRITDEQFVRQLAAAKAAAYPPNTKRYYDEMADELAALHETIKTQHDQNLAQRQDHHDDNKTQAAKQSDQTAMVSAQKDVSWSMKPAMSSEI